jgi:pyruvate dehydrogenase E2 component (dihydrolipoamide acetyltransferase)
MTYEFRLPDVGEGIAEAEIVRWLVQDGDRVRLDQPIVEIETDKAVVEVPAPVAGIVVRRGGEAGDTLHVGDLLVVFDQANGALPAVPQQPAPVAPSPSQAATPSRPASPPEDGPAAARPLATPAVRKLAREREVDLAGVQGTGPGGRITAEDVEASARKGAPASAGHPAQHLEATAVEAADAVPRPSRPFVEVGSGADDERVPLRGLRRRIAEAMSESWRTIPHITGMDEVDVSGLVALRDRYRAAEGPGGLHLTYLPFIVKAVVAGLEKHPIVNAVLDEPAGEVVYRRRYNIGIATATADGLIVPVVHDAGRRSIRELQEEIASLSEEARTRKIALSALQGGTFTITNFGSLGGWLGTPIIRPGEAAILGVGRIQDKPWVVEGQIVVRPVLALSFSADHRLIDGDVATAFVQTVAGYLSNPLSLFLDLT